ncbi:hypothetical protein [uncultured Nonlabens sp.]|uniref:hypothetical protein n=1 Tax=uncultured Nonlabens sp. TaxID=859306 RepID=UPI002617E3EF|nr:hypothetical protein [uncultured Nonlabens sp.]
MFKIHPELQLPFVIITGILIIIYLTLLKFTGNYSFYIAIGVNLLLSGLIAIFSSVLANWGRSYNTADFYSHLLVLFIASTTIALFLKFGIYDTLKKTALLNTKNIIVFVVVTTLGLRYLIKYERYSWKAALKTSSQIKVITSSLGDMQSLRTNRTVFYRDPLSYVTLEEETHRFSPRAFRGMPDYINLAFYDTKEHLLYYDSFDISHALIRKAIGYGIFYPLTGSRKYSNIYLEINNKGHVALFLSQNNQKKLLFEAKCKSITPDLLPNYLTDRYETQKVLELYEVKENELHQNLI